MLSFECIGLTEEEHSELVLCGKQYIIKEEQDLKRNEHQKQQHSKLKKIKRT